MSSKQWAGIGALAAFVTVCVLVGGSVFAAAEGLPLTTGWYWALALSTTAGSEITPHDASGHVIAVIVLLTAVPALGALFARLIAVHTSVWFHQRHGAAMHAELAATRRMIADLHKQVTGKDHPDAPPSKEIPHE